MDNIISASILSANFAQLERQILECEQAGVDWIHIDVMDGHFVPNLTMGPFIVEHCRRITNLPLDCHLMVEKPETLVRDFANAGASVITIHPEVNPNVHRTVQLIQNLGCKAGVALNPGTSHFVIESMLDFLDLILIMTVNPGFSGQVFIPEMTKKIQAVSEMAKKQNNNIYIEVDGGISASNITEVRQAGANAFVSATSIFGHPKGITAGIHDLRQALVK